MDECNCSVFRDIQNFCETKGINEIGIDFFSIFHKSLSNESDIEPRINEVVQPVEALKKIDIRKSIDDKTMKAELEASDVLRFGEISVFKTVMRFNPYWD